MSNKYWIGAEHAVLKKDDIVANWINTPHGEKGLKAKNKAFCIWYYGRKTTDNAFSSMMTKSLEDCGTTGWGGLPRTIHTELEKWERILLILAIWRINSMRS